MAFNPSPKVDCARQFAERFKKKQVIILSIDDDENLEYTSYGRNKALCQTTKILADIAFDAIMYHYGGIYQEG